MFVSRTNQVKKHVLRYQMACPRKDNNMLLELIQKPLTDKHVEENRESYSHNDHEILKTAPVPTKT